MTAALLQVDPGLRIFHRNGMLFAGRLSGTMRLQRIGPPDLVLLSMFLLPGAPEDRARGFVEGPGSRLFPAPPPLSNVLARIAQLRDAGVLVAGVRQGGDGRAAGSLQDCAACAPVAADSAWRLSSNFLLQATPSGFAVNSPVRQDPVVLDVELALLLTAFTAGRPAGEVVAAHPAIGSPEQRLKAIHWLAEQRVLLPHDAKAESLAGQVQQDTFAVNRSAGDQPAWQQLEPDGRIPVYFVPHMENHYPLALGMIAAALRVHAGGRLTERFQLLPITYMSPQELIDGPYRRFGPGVWLFSNYMWSLAVNLQVSAAVKRLDGRNLTIHGGPSTPNYEVACQQFYARHGSVDLAVHGEGEVATAEAFECLQRDPDGGIRFDPEALERVAGISFRDPADRARVVRAPARMRLRQLDALPSPYLEGVFDDYAGRVEAAIVETNRGCPFACTFCDWGSATNGKIAKFEHGRVRDEIDWIGRNKVRVLWIADANFGMLPADLDFAEWVVETKRRYGFPQEVVVNYTKNANTRLADIIRVFSGAGIVSQGIISIQTTDEETLRIIDRQNIKTSKYDELLQVFADAGLPLSTDLMIGLPGATVASFARDLQRYLDVDVAVKAYPTQLLPNSPMAAPEYREKYRIEVDENDFVVACHSFTREDLARMKALNNVYVATEGYGALRFVYRFLQWDRGIQATDVMQALVDQVAAEPDRFPAVTWVMRFFAVEKHMPGGWRAFYDEIADFVRARWGIERDSALDTVLRANELSMPDEARSYPLEVELPHDIVAWFRAHGTHGARDASAGLPLARHAPGRFAVDDPDGLARIDRENLQYDSHQYFWELRSPIARVCSPAGHSQGIAA